MRAATIAAVDRRERALAPLSSPLPTQIGDARQEGTPGQLVPPSELTLADFARHLSLSARQRTAGAYLDTLQRLLGFQVGPVAGRALRPRALPVQKPAGQVGGLVGAAFPGLLVGGELVELCPAGVDRRRRVRRSPSRSGLRGQAHPPDPRRGPPSSGPWSGRRRGRGGLSLPMLSGVSDTVAVEPSAAEFRQRGLVPSTAAEEPMRVWR